MKLATRRGGDALAIRDRYTGDPDDLFAVGNQRQHVAKMSRNVGVDQDVLEAFWLCEPQRAHPVTRLAAGDRQRKPNEVGVEVTNLVASLEGRPVAAAGFDGQAWR